MRISTCELGPLMASNWRSSLALEVLFRVARPQQKFPNPAKLWKPMRRFSADPKLANLWNSGPANLGMRIGAVWWSQRSRARGRTSPFCLFRKRRSVLASRFSAPQRPFYCSILPVFAADLEAFVRTECRDVARRPRVRMMVDSFLLWRLRWDLPRRGTPRCVRLHRHRAWLTMLRPWQFLSYDISSRNISYRFPPSRPSLRPAVLLATSQGAPPHSAIKLGDGCRASAVISLLSTDHAGYSFQTQSCCANIVRRCPCGTSYTPCLSWRPGLLSQVAIR